MSEIKVCVLGPVGVGKTSLCRSYNDEFSNEQQPTIAVESRAITVRGKDLVLYDTAGQEQYHATTYQYCRNAAALLFVFDIRSRESFDELSNIRHTVLEKVSGAPAVFVVGNMLDLANGRQVNRDEGQERADEWEATYFEVSARTNDRVTELFTEVAEKAVAPNAISSEPIPEDGGVLRSQCCT
jgi:small GTP-binding protein